MATNIFPGVYTTIVDNSFFIQPLPGAIGYIAFFSEKGPDNQVRLTTSVNDLIETYGKGDPVKYGQGWYVAMQYLTILGSLYTMRVMPNDAKYSCFGLKNDPVLNEAHTLTLSTGPASMGEMKTLLVSNIADVLFYPTGRGPAYDALSIKLTKTATSGTGSDYDYTYMLDIFQKMDGYTFDSLIESFTVSFDRDARDMSGESMFIEYVLERYSQHLRAVVSETLLPIHAKTSDFAAPFTGNLYLTGGSFGSTNIYDHNGYLNNTDPAVISLLAAGYTGYGIYNPLTGDDLRDISDPDVLQFSIIFDGGYPTPVKDVIVALCESRRDCMCFLDNGDNVTSTQAKAMRNGTHNYNTMYAALYEPYTKIYDTFTGKYIWMTPVYHVARAFAMTERDYDLWWPFAGLNRGMCTGVKEIRYTLAGQHKDDFKLNQINPIMRWPAIGDVIWGNWTTLRRPSVLQNIHVVLCLLYIKRVLEWNLKYFIYEFNDNQTWETIQASVSEFLAFMQSKRALEYFQVSVFATDYDKKLNRCQVSINLKVTGAIEVINITLIAN